jgi:hypothetical protein
MGPSFAALGSYSLDATMESGVVDESAMRERSEESTAPQPRKGQRRPIRVVPPSRTSRLFGPR